MVGLKVSDVDRTNTSTIILLCKIINKYLRNDEFMYAVAAKDGIIKEHFDSLAFLDLIIANLGSLRAVNVNGLSTITFLQASQIYTNFKSTETCKYSGPFGTMLDNMMGGNQNPFPGQLHGRYGG
ncbi:unnamed protein product, partial [Rotaria sp. Silwood1]